MENASVQGPEFCATPLHTSLQTYTEKGVMGKVDFF